MRLQVVIAASVLAVILIGLSTDVDGQLTRGVRRRNRFGRIGRSRSRIRLRSGGGRGGRGGSSSCGENQRRKRGGRCVPKSQDPKGVPAKKGSMGPLPGAPNLNEITSIVTRWLDENAERIPNMVQLVFHSCVGGCDGCINTNSPSNKGLIGSYREVQALWKNEAKQGISLADFVVLLGTKAVEHGMRRNGGPGPRTVEFTTGRTSCRDPTNYLKVFNFPQGQNTDAIEFLMSHFGIPSRGLAVALMGWMVLAHNTILIAFKRHNLEMLVKILNSVIIYIMSSNNIRNIYTRFYDITITRKH
ncbi:hypothetical protein EB796_012556 [Bugula neritina]|uniref:Plant heme peroxidase family profile domain-containing protein n=1 Tax=Bugula neritina TaxID=10212 RepID=A0A7J7JS42_BUGNE|nr:hypothetical protein EB796_012556 [Bugula neritina]